jgi:hypothetical protein
MGWCAHPIYKLFMSLILHLIVVVRTGDHTLIGKRDHAIQEESSTKKSSGQIAALTGSESGNKSPLAVEMSVSLFSNGPWSLHLRTAVTL